MPHPPGMDTIAIRNSQGAIRLEPHELVHTDIALDDYWARCALCALLDSNHQPGWQL